MHTAAARLQPLRCRASLQAHTHAASAQSLRGLHDGTPQHYGVRWYSPEVAPRVQANWYALVANAEFMLHDVQNEAFAEQLRERVRLFGEKNRKLDFFLVSEPTWLDAQFPQEAKRVGRPCVALVSTDKIWITCAATLCSSALPKNTCGCCEDLHASQPQCCTSQATACTACPQSHHSLMSTAVTQHLPHA